VSGSKALSGGSGAEPPVGVRGRRSPEAESSVAFEAPAELPNLTLVPDSFCTSYGETLMFISQKFGVAKSVVFGGVG